MSIKFEYTPKEKQFELAKKLFRIAKEKSKFYAEKFKYIENVETYKDWLKIPILTRDEIRNNVFPYSTDIMTQDVKSSLMVSTGGTSGVARYTAFTYEEWDRFVEIQAKALALLGVDEDDIVANLMVCGNMWPSFIGSHDVIRKLNATHLPISVPDDAEMTFKYLETFKPTVLLSVPSVLILLTDFLKQQEKTIKCVKTIQFVGEPLSEHARKYIESVFVNARISAVGYSSADCGLMGYQCDFCSNNEYHIPTEAQFIEIYNFEEERICEDGEIGEIVVTSLHRFLLPIIRYRIGDMGYIKKEPCACGDKNPVLVLKGRAGEDFKIGGAYVSMGEIEKAFMEFVSEDGISANYQIELTENKEGRLGFILRIESSNPENSKRHENNIITSLKNIPIIQMGFDTEYFSEFRVEFVKIGSLTRSPITGKVKRLIDNRVDDNKA